eukprot:10095_1
MSNIANATETKETKETKEADEKVKKHKSGFKSGRFSKFTDVFGVFVAFGGRSKGSCFSRHQSLEDANKAGKKTYESYCADKSSSDESIFCDSPFSGFIILGYGSNTASISVEEIDIDKCQMSELKNLAQKNNISYNSSTRKSDLLQLIKPIIQHKIHLNRYKDVDYLNCNYCKTNNKKGYDIFIEERNKNPTIVKFNAMNKMYNKSLLDPIKERDVKSKYCLTENDLEEAVIAQKLHWNKRSCFGNQYRLYERSEVIAYYKEKKQKEEKENNLSLPEKKQIKSNKNRKRKQDDDEKDEEPTAKKQKLNSQ